MGDAEAPALSPRKVSSGSSFLRPTAKSRRVRSGNDRVAVPRQEPAVDKRRAGGVQYRMSRFRFYRSRRPLDLAVDMAGVRMGERLLQAGAGDARAFATIAAKVGLTGRACAVADTSEAVHVLERAAARQGVLVEVVGVQGGAWPFDAASFDIALVDGNALIGAADGERQTRLGEIRRVVRPGGRVLAVYRSPRSLMMRLGFESRARPASPLARFAGRSTGPAGSARLLAEREGCVCRGVPPGVI